MNTELPPLPEPASGEKIYKGYGNFDEIAYYTAGQMREYALAARSPRPAGSDDSRGGWQPIETAPKEDRTYFLAANAHGVWVAHWQAKAVSGFVFDNPWRSVMLNHWHIVDKDGRYEPATHWMPLPEPPASRSKG